jgi:hypothetical protein
MKRSVLCLRPASPLFKATLIRFPCREKVDALKTTVRPDYRYSILDKLKGKKMVLILGEAWQTDGEDCERDSLPFHPTETIVSSDWIS